MMAYEVDSAKPLAAWKRGWSTAKTQIGVECRIHDLRHRFISIWFKRKLLRDYQAISGHLSRRMLEH